MKLRTLALAGIALAALATPAAAGQGWYLGLGAGWNDINNVRGDSAALGGSARANFKNGWDGLATLGYGFGDWRFEVEGDYARNEARSLMPGIAFASDDLHGRITQPGVFGNLLWDIPLSDTFALTLGGGAGVRWTEVHINDTDSGDFIRGSNGRFAWQGIGGFTWHTAPNFDLQLDYRYGETNRSNAMIDGIFPASVASKTNQSLMLSLRWYLQDEERAAPPPMAPMPPPPPPPPPMPQAVKTFIVFFDFDKSNLTAEAQSVVSEAVKAAQQNGWVKVMVTGHTDTVGSDTYNQSLSERRADAVKDAMVGMGMSADNITTQGKSFHDPLVATGPGVREPQNRRAVIEY